MEVLLGIKVLLGKGKGEMNSWGSNQQVLPTYSKGKLE